MRRNRELLTLILLNAEGEEPRPDLSAFSEKEIVHHAAYLIKHGYLEGSVLDNERGVAYTGLTESGCDYLEQQREGEASPKNIAVEMSLDFFISHSSADEPLAEGLVQLLQLAFSIPSKRIRCTSVPGFRMEAGADTDEQIRREVLSCRMLIGLLTPKSLASSYVLFELGARWVLDRALVPLLAKGAKPDGLPGPLKGKNALNASRREDLAQFLEDIGHLLGLQCAPISSVTRKMDDVIRLAEESASSSHSGSSVEKHDEEASYDVHDIQSLLTHFLELNLSDGTSQVFRFAQIDSKLGIPAGSAKAHLAAVARAEHYDVMKEGAQTIHICSPMVF